MMKYVLWLCFFCAGAQADLKAFDCGSSGTKWNGNSATPTMTAACLQTDGVCASASSCKAGETYEAAKKWVGSGNDCFAAATAGNRIVSKADDLKTWKSFRKFFNTCKSWKGVKNMVFVQPGSQTLPGTGEAFFEAYFADKKGRTGFFSAGGASAQYGFKMCNKKVVDAWSTYVNAIKGDLATTQCSTGTEDKLEAFVATTCSTKLGAMDMGDVKASFEGHEGTDFISSGSVKFSPGAVGNWALGSLLLGPSCGTGAVAGMNQIWANFEAANPCATAATKDQGCDYSTVKRHVDQDPVLPELKKFIKVYTDECDPDMSHIVWPAGMKFSRKEESELASAKTGPDKFHGDWAPMITNAIAHALGCKAAKDVIDREQGDDTPGALASTYPKYEVLTYGWLDDLPSTGLLTETLSFSSDSGSGADLERLEDDLDALRATINQLEN